MPHIILECSNNVNHACLKDVLPKIHDYLVEALPTKLESCKSRVVLYKDYLIADGHHDLAFVHITIKILAGRSEELLQSISQNVLKMLEEFLLSSAEGLIYKLSVAIENLPSNYCKN